MNPAEMSALQEPVFNEKPTSPHHKTYHLRKTNRLKGSFLEVSDVSPKKLLNRLNTDTSKKYLSVLLGVFFEPRYTSHAHQPDMTIKHVAERWVVLHAAQPRLLQGPRAPNTRS